MIKTMQMTEDEKRQKAEDIIKLKHDGRIGAITDTEKLKLHHELEVHQIELEMQNEELLQSKAETKAAQKYTDLYEAAPVSFYTLDSKSKIYELNAIASRLLDQTKEELINSHFTSFIYDEDRLLYDSFIKNVFRTQAQCSCELRIQTPASQTPVYIVLTGIAENPRNKCLLAALDITEQKKAQQSIIENHRLSAIGEMASSVAHDFNNSLQSLLGNLELALIVKDNSKYLNTMLTLITDVAARVRQLQRFGGNGSGKEQFASVNIISLVEDVIAQTRPLWKDQAEAKGISIHIEHQAEKEFEVPGNKGELRAALFNIIKNGIEAMPNGGIIKITQRMDLNYIFLTIADTGIGMNEETKIRIFQPFFSTKDLNPGRGMGMSSVLSIIKEHKGEVCVKSTAPGEGTTIEIKLPLPEKRNNTHDLNNQASVSEIKRNTTFNILWVDDDDEIRVFAKEAIKFMGHNVTMAESGREALQHLKNNKYDLVITDIGMPEMNGWQLADKIKEEFGELKVAVISGWGDQISEKELLAHGVKYMLNKPFQLSQLTELLDSIE